MDARKIILAGIGGGLMLGTLAGAVTPTSMKQAPEPFFLAGSHGKDAGDETDPVASFRFVEAGPADLDPGLAFERDRAIALAGGERDWQSDPEFVPTAVTDYEPLNFDRYEVSAPAPLPEPVARSRVGTMEESPEATMDRLFGRDPLEPAGNDRAARSAAAALDAARDAAAAAKDAQMLARLR